jgi:membrane-bound serine protease (ClpP class)
MQPSPASSSSPRIARRCLAALLTAFGVLPLLAGVASAASSHTASRNAANTTKPSISAASKSPDYNGIDVVQVTGFIDPPNAALILHSIHEAEGRDSTALIFQMDSSGATDTDPIALAKAVRASTVPVVVWVGPAGSEIRGGAALIGEAASWLSLSSNSHIGPIYPLRVDAATSPADNEAALRAITRRSASAFAAVAHHTLSANAAKRVGAADSVDPVLGDLVVGLDGKTLPTASGPVRLSTAQVTTVNKQPRREPNQDVRFAKLSLAGQFQHTLIAPWVAYFLLAVGASLIVFEFFTISIGIAGVIGAFSLAFAFYGYSHLPVHWWAVGLLLFCFFAFAVDVQAGGLGPWTIIATVALIVGSIFLYGGTAQVQPAWWTQVLVIGGVILFMIGGMTAMLRSRFGTPTVGREGMIGELGLAEVDIDPDGVARVREALWRARTNRATPVKHGEIVRVVAVEGLVLEVEPETGGTRDHRDRRSAAK